VERDERSDTRNFLVGTGPGYAAAPDGARAAASPSVVQPRRFLMSDRFPHHRLDAYRLSLDLGVAAKNIGEVLVEPSKKLLPRFACSFAERFFIQGS
jgi:hypothetical protein